MSESSGPCGPKPHSEHASLLASFAATEDARGTLLYCAGRQAGGHEVLFNKLVDVAGKLVDRDEAEHIALTTMKVGAERSASGIGSPFRYLCESARNAARAIVRKRQLRTRHERAAARPEGVDDERPGELAEELQAGLATLAEAARYLLEQLFYRGRTARSLAIELGVSRSTVYKRRNAALRLLRARFEQ